MTLNVRGIGNQKKRRAIFDHYRFLSDFLVLQETHSSKEIEQIWESEWGGRIIYSHGTTNARGVAILISKEFRTKVRNIETDEDGRYIIVDLHEIDEVIVTVVGIYAPNKDDPEFFKRIAQKLRSRSESKIILGDFNLVLDIEKDRKNTYNNNMCAMFEVENMIDEFSLIEIWRTRNEQKSEFSWIKLGKEQKASRIDFALVSRGLDHNIDLVQYISGFCTDHRALYFNLDISRQERGCGYWKFNNQLLQNAEFVQLMNCEIQQTLESSAEKKPSEQWEMLKQRIKKFAIKFSKSKVRDDKLIIGQLMEAVNEYESRLPLNRDETQLCTRTKIDLEEKVMERASGLIFRSKARWQEYGEKNTQYFFSLEKARYNAKTCYKIFDEDGNEVSTNQGILQVQQRFYQELYDVDQEVEFTLHNSYNIYVPEEIRTQQNQQIMMEELASAIKSMNNNKTPGQDGIPVDFYKVFWNQLKSSFHAMMLEVFENDILHSTARQGILNLIPKANKDTRYIKNLRPITLLNTDYKIIEKAVANKMIPALEHIIHQDQRGFMKNRRISVNIRKFLDIMHNAEKEDLEQVVLSLDFVKCFDKCSFLILHGSLEFFKFGEIVKTWTHILYKDFTVRVQNNGHFSDAIPIKKGVHQGGCCSSIYFLVIAEILAIALRENQEIDGVMISFIKHLLNQFADDMDIFSECNKKSLLSIFEELKRFQSQSGFTVSYDKTTLYRIGSLRHSNAKLYDIDQFKWSNEDITVLGVTIAHEDLIEKNYGDIVQKVKTVLGAWHNRGLTLLGKVQVVNTLVASLFVYKMSVLPQIPEGIVKNVDNIVRQFLWNGKKAKIAYAILQNPKKDGGLNLVNLKKKDKSLKATWPQTLKNEEDYSTLVYKILHCSRIGEDIWRCSLSPADVNSLRIDNNFWRDVLLAWSEYNFYNDRRIDNQLIWYNSEIRIQSKVVLWLDAYEKGLKYVYQLFEGGNFKSHAMIKSEYGLSEIRYNSLKVAIPKEWKDFFKSGLMGAFLPVPPHNYDLACNLYGKSFSRRVYRYLADDVMLVHNKYLKWIQEIGTDFCEGICDFGIQHTMLYKVTNITKYRSFQYRLLQRGLVTNIQMKKWGMITSDLCSFCQDHPETLVHLFFECPKIQSLWQEVLDYCRSRFKVHDMSLNAGSIIKNQLVKKASHVVNFVCLVTKQYIYRQRCIAQNINITELKAIFSHIESIEKYVAIKNEKLNHHLKKWLCD